MALGEAGSAVHARSRHYHTLDAFRGLAAIGVALFHFRWTHPELNTSGPLERLFNLLDFFFLLSGFMLAHAYLSKPLDLGTFVWRRLARLYPLHVFALLMFLLLQLGKLAATSLGIGSRTEAFDGMNVVNFMDTLLLLQSTGLLWDHISWNYPSWTVSTELASAVIIYALVARFGRRMQEPLCIGILVAAAVYMFVYAVEPRDYGPDALIRTLYGVAMGCVLYSLHASFQVIHGRVWGTVAEVSAIGLVIVLISNPATKSVWYLCNFGLVAVIYVFAAEQGLLSVAARRLQLHRLGTGSYSIYLNHALIGTIFSKLYLSIAPLLGISGLISVAIYVPTFVLVLVAYSRVTLVYVERPGHKLWIRAGQMISSSPRLGPALLSRPLARIAGALRGQQPFPR